LTHILFIDARVVLVNNWLNIEGVSGCCHLLSIVLIVPVAPMLVGIEPVSFFWYSAWLPVSWDVLDCLDSSLAFTAHVTESFSSLLKVWWDEAASGLSLTSWLSSSVGVH
jgi:hypothetical protein